MGDVGFRIDGPPGAPVLVLSNSLGTNWRMWEPQVAVLTGHFRVVRYDQRGHGVTDALEGPYALADLGADLLGLLDHLDVARASLCGVSLGGLVCMWVAAHAPERVERLVVASTAPHFPPRGPWIERAERVRAEGTAWLLDGLLERWFTPGFVARAPEIVRLVAEMLAGVDPDGYACCCEAIAGSDERSALDRIGAPTLVLAGAADPVAPPTVALELHEAIAGSSLVVVPSAAHLVNLEQPGRFNAAVLEHLIATPAERGDKVRREVLGHAHVDRTAGRDPFTSAFQDLITAYAWGEVWSRPGLERRERSLVTLGMLVALGRFDELALHVRAARTNGLSDDEIAEVLLQTAVYAGVPAANTAFKVAARALREDDEAEDE
jgi:3-oxoadipate enol-lactonase / 4-carboxymuconolactone decarboxylase